ncbi:hypothetical protein [Streptomyces jumonjinensis]|uniref:DUF3040 domain-containing protein n=1 Tax=Streptomyces jumonjinensis TaxID=1945 RepID=A0A646KDZ6_STRJU|nr:hypothetical protein [Streptomyces jumonjinensis]MQS99225.1 hypothetical protein [Streptomyces jumonjinensis]
MSRLSRREEQVRRMLADRPAPVPTGLVERAVTHGERLRRRRTVRRAAWALLMLAVIAFTVWAAAVEPWGARTTVHTTPALKVW